MARKQEYRAPAPAIFVICEGEKTEPAFFMALTHKYTNSGINYTIYPKYKDEDEDHDASRGSRKAPTRHVEQPFEPVITGQPPLKWVEYAKKQLDSKAFEEVWAVYDKDDHPKHEEAWQYAIDNNVNIGFTSRSFEYYSLLHYEYLYMPFQSTECKGHNPNHKGSNINNTELWCGPIEDPKRSKEKCVEKDCHGTLCINGYAREHRYWQESKSGSLLHSIDKETLIQGIINAIKLRHESDQTAGHLEIYLRNPYVSVDKLVQRIIGITGVEIGEAYCEPSGVCFAYLDGSLSIHNRSKGNLLLSPNFGTIHSKGNKGVPIFDSTTILPPGHSITKSLILTPSQHIRIPQKNTTIILTAP